MGIINMIMLKKYGYNWCCRIVVWIIIKGKQIMFTGISQTITKYQIYSCIMSQFLHKSIQPQRQIHILCLAQNRWHVSCTQKDTSFLFFFHGEKEQRQSKKKRKPETATTSIVKCQGKGWDESTNTCQCGSREKREDERGDETRREGRGVGARGDKCLDSGFRDNSHNGRHP